VGLNFLAYLPAGTVSQIFPGNILDNPANDATYRQLLGLRGHKPFECVGDTGEARLAMEICARKGLDGSALRIYRREALPMDIASMLGRYLAVEPAAIPAELGERILPLLREGAWAARDYIGRYL
jgi:hypothetical protein